jgi:hypothetical protein
MFKLSEKIAFFKKCRLRLASHCIQTVVRKKRKMCLRTNLFFCFLFFSPSRFAEISYDSTAILFVFRPISYFIPAHRNLFSGYKVFFLLMPEIFLFC